MSLIQATSTTGGTTSLGEMMAAVSLLTATLKFEHIAVQLQGDGPLNFIANGNHQQQLRGIARVRGEITDTDIRMVGGGQLRLRWIRAR